jgi:hypothetical protein
LSVQPHRRPVDDPRPRAAQPPGRRQRRHRKKPDPPRRTDGVDLTRLLNHGARRLSPPECRQTPPRKGD